MAEEVKATEQEQQEVQGTAPETSEEPPAKSELTLKATLDIIEQIYPAALAESWDHPGLTLGDLKKPVRKIACAVDITPEVIAEASKSGADLLITHHPLFFRAEHLFGGDTFRGEMLNQLIKSDIAHLSIHTNCDRARGGTADALALLLELQDIQPMVRATYSEDEVKLNPALKTAGLGRVGNLKTPTNLAVFAKIVQELLNQYSLLREVKRPVMFAGPLDAEIRKVAVLPGAGDSEFEAARKAGADVYITSDLRHHPAQDQLSANTLQKPMWLIDTPHAQVEGLWFGYLANKFEELAAKTAVTSPKFVPISLNTDVWTVA